MKKHSWISALSALALLFAGCARVEDIGYTGPRTRDMDQFAIAYLNALQPLSFAANREYCGYFGRDALGYVIASPPTRGYLDSCRAAALPDGGEPLASYHTHGAFDPSVITELPSPADLAADAAENVVGYVSTPGGRVWRNAIDGSGTRQLCGAGCVLVDKAYVTGIYGTFKTRYTAVELQQRFEE